MMKRSFVRRCLRERWFWGSAAPSAAALLGLTTGAPSLTAAGASFDYFEFDGRWRSFRLRGGP